MKDGYYLIPIADLETLLSLNELRELSDEATRDRLIRRIGRNKQRVNLTTTRTIALPSATTTTQYELNFID